MQRPLIIFIYLILGLFLLFLGWHIREAYRVLPADVTKPMALPPYAGWREFSNQSVGYKVKFPALPQQATDTVQEPNSGEVRHYEMSAATQDDGTTYVVSRIIFENVRPTERLDLERYRDEIIGSQPEGELISENRGEMVGYPSLAFTFVSKITTTECRLFLVDHQLFLLMVLSPKHQTFPKENAHYFFDSFQWIKAVS